MLQISRWLMVIQSQQRSSPLWPKSTFFLGQIAIFTGSNWYLMVFGIVFDIVFQIVFDIVFHIVLDLDYLIVFERI